MSRCPNHYINYTLLAAAHARKILLKEFLNMSNVRVADEFERVLGEARESCYALASKGMHCEFLPGLSTGMTREDCEAWIGINLESCLADMFGKTPSADLFNAAKLLVRLMMGWYDAGMRGECA